jgi:methylisocitrate lyase
MEGAVMTADHDTARSPGARLRALVAEDIVPCPGVYDALSARLTEAAGFRCCFAMSISVALATYGLPDMGLVTQTEMRDTVLRITDAVDIPLLVDADDGFGTSLSVARTVTLLERAGAAGVQIEDMATPKRPGVLGGKQVIDADEMARRVTIAKQAQTDPDFVLVARTDARGVTDLDDCVRRLKLYEAAGADIVYCAQPQGVEEVKQLADAVSVPLQITSSEARAGIPRLTLEEYRELGASLVVYPQATILASYAATAEVLEEIHRTQSNEGVMSRLRTFDELNELAGYDGWMASFR